MSTLPQSFCFSLSPLFRKPTAMLRGHAAPIFYLFIADQDNRIFSISTDRCIKVGLFFKSVFQFFTLP